MTNAARLGADVIEGVVHGHPCRMYRDRPATVTELTYEGRRWATRDFIVHGERRVSYARHELAVGLAGRLLQAHGVGTGDRVAIFARNSAEWSVAFFAALRIGAVAVPCNGWWSADEVAHACREVSPAVVVTDERSRSRVPDGVPHLALEEITACLEAADAAGSGAELEAGPGRMWTRCPTLSPRRISSASSCLPRARQVRRAEWRSRTVR